MTILTQEVLSQMFQSFQSIQLNKMVDRHLLTVLNPIRNRQKNKKCILKISLVLQKYHQLQNTLLILRNIYITSILCPLVAWVFMHACKNKLRPTPSLAKKHIFYPPSVHIKFIDCGNTSLQFYIWQQREGKSCLQGFD